MTLGSGEERSGINLALKLVHTVRVSGLIVDPQGPATNLGVRLLPLGIDEFAAESGMEVATTATDASGAFTFLGVPSGQYTLKVLKAPRPTAPVLAPPSDGFAAAFTEEAAQARAARAAAAAAGGALDQTVWATSSITVGSTDVKGLSVTLRSGLRVSGRVEFVGTKEQPPVQQLTRVTINLTPLAARPITVFAPGRLGADAQFTSSGFPPGKYLVTATAPIGGWSLLSIMHGNRDVSDEPLDLESTDVSGLVVTFTDKLTELSGTIVDARGAAHTTAEVIAFPADSDIWKQGAFGTRRIRLTPATKFGTYAVSGLPPGQYFIVAVDEGATAEWQDPKFLERVQRGATRVTLTGGERKTQALTLAVVR